MLSFLKTNRPSPPRDDVPGDRDEEKERRATRPTPAEIHVALLTGEPNLHAAERGEDEPRFVSLLVPFY